MTVVTRILACVQAQDARWSGTPGPLFLTLSSATGDLFTSTWAMSHPNAAGEVVPDGAASLAPLPLEHRRDPGDRPYYLIYADFNPYTVALETDEIAPAGARLVVRTDNLLRPRHVIVWGEADLPAGRGRLDAHEPPEIMTTPIPIALALDVAGVDLSSDNREGPQTMVLPAARPTRGRATAITRLLVVVGLGDDGNANTSAPVSVRVRRDSGLVVDADLADFDRLRPGEAKAWLVSDEVTSFDRTDLERRDRLSQDTVTLHVLGEEKAQIARVVVFGLSDGAVGAPAPMHPLVYAGMKTPLTSWVGGTTAAQRKLKLSLANYLP